MIINENSKVIHFSNKKLESNEVAHLPITESKISGRTFLASAYGNIYFSKVVGKYSLTNELIGSYLSKRIGLDTVDYEIGQNGENLYALSKSFYEDGYSYEYFRDYFQLPNISKKSLLRSINPFRAFCITDGLDILEGTSLYSYALKLIAVDLKMAQVDRNDTNLQIKISENGIPTFAPIYDYGESYLVGDLATFYFSPLVWVKKNNISLKELIRRHPLLLDYIEQLNDISMYTILADISDEKRITFTGDEIFTYAKSQKLINRQFKKIKSR